MLHIKSKVRFIEQFFCSKCHQWLSGAVVQSADNPFGEPSDFIDPLSLPDSCSRDVPYLRQLGVNTIRVYSVNSSLNHDSCMSALSAAGIYTMFVFFVKFILISDFQNLASTFLYL